jgi:N-acetylmuramoyl-L-alanine amidase
LGLVLAGVVARGAEGPDWASLEAYQGTVTADTFARLVHEVYAPDGGLIDYLRYGPGEVSVFGSASQTGAPLFTLRFAEVEVPPVRREVGMADAPLSGLRIALDPGHIGGAWARMEERFFLVNRATDWPVQEAAMNLHVAHLLRERLAAAGAEVVMVKDGLEPVTGARPDALFAVAGEPPAADPRFAHLPEVFVESSRRDALRKQAERAFFRTAEIAARAERINRELRPHVTLCIHFNATGYGDEKTLYDENGLAFFVYGNVMARELRDDGQKFHLMAKLLERSHEEELGLTRSIAAAYAGATGLPPSYRVGPGGVMHPMDEEGYIYARNLAANRQFRGAVIFLEPYFMNNRTVYARIQAGDYEGEREVDGRSYRSIFREYADAVAAGVVAYYGGVPGE